MKFGSFVFCRLTFMFFIRKATPSNKQDTPRSTHNLCPRQDPGQTQFATLVLQTFTRQQPRYITLICRLLYLHFPPCESPLVSSAPQHRRCPSVPHDMAVEGARYTIEQLKALRASPLVRKPDELPSIDEWIE
jgi:hypothetical protein